MASFTDAISQFNPYVQQLPVDLMAKVGMQKQAQYDAGVQKVQSYIDNIAGLDVSEKHKEYLTSKMNALGNNLTAFTAADFSNQQVVSTVSGMATQIAKDPIIESGVYSAQRIKKGYQDMDEARKKGTLTPENERQFTRDLQNWYKDKDLKTKFTGEYKPYFDWESFIKKEFDAVKPDGFQFQDVFQTDSNGKVVRDKNGTPLYSKTMLDFEYKGIFPEKVKSTLDRLMSDPRVSQQLDITGNYIYENADPESLVYSVRTEKQKSVENLLAELDNLTLRQKAGQDVDYKIAQINNRLAQTNHYYDSIEQEALSNPDRVKGLLYKNKMINDYTSQYSTVEVKRLLKDNPAWRADFDLQKEANAQLRWARDYSQKERFKSIDITEKEKDRQLARELALLRGKGKGVDINGDGIPDEDSQGRVLRQGREPSDIDVIFDADRQYRDAGASLIATGDGFLAATVLNTDATTKAIDKLMSTGMTKDEALTQAIDNAAKQRGMSPEEYRTYIGNAAINTFNKMSPEERSKSHGLTDSYNAFVAARRNFLNATIKKKERDKLVANTMSSEEFKNSELSKFKPITGTYLGKKITVTPEDQYNLALYLNANTSIFPASAPSSEAKAVSKEAERKLQEAGKGYLIDAAINQNVDLSAEGTTALWRGLGKAAWAITGATHKLFTGDTGLPEVNLGHLSNAVRNLNNTALSASRKKEADVIKKFEGKMPTLESTLFVGDDKYNKGVLNELKSVVAKALTSNAQLSEDAKTFAKAIVASEDPDKLGGITINYRKGQGQVPIVELSRTTAEGLEGTFTLTEDDAQSLGINLGNVYEPEEVKNIRDVMKYRGGKTSAGNPKERSTYYNGDVQFEKNDFPALSSTSYKNLGADIKANIYQNNGINYGVFYIKRPGEDVVLYEVPGEQNLQKLVEKMKLAVTPQFVNAIR